jgi:transcriptional regulator with XRE-family HTH domain
MRKLRLERRQTQEEFWIDFLKMSVDFGSMVERGITAPSFETIENICGALGITETELFTFSETPDHAGSRGRVKKTAAEKKRSRKTVSKRKRHAG